MGKLLRGANWYLEVRGREHFPFHFHVIGPDFAAQIDAHTLEIMELEGRMPRTVKQEAMEWAKANRAALVAEWNRMNPDLTVTL